jgi:hypothetical protein
MLTLIKRNQNEYVIADERKNFCAELSEKEAVNYLKMICIPDSQIEAGFIALVENGHDVAEFGITGSFLYSRKACASNIEIMVA